MNDFVLTADEWQALLLGPVSGPGWNLVCADGETRPMDDVRRAAVARIYRLEAVCVERGRTIDCLTESLARCRQAGGK